MDMNFWVLEEMVKSNKEELNRELRFKETYKLYEGPIRKKVCIDLRLIKFCI